MLYESRNPNTGELLASYDVATAAEVDATLERARAAFSSWRKLSFAERAAPWLRVAAILEERAEAIGAQMATEMGKPYVEGVAEARKCASVCRFYAEQAEELLQPIPHESDGSECIVRYDPLGPVLAVMPWNFPFWQVYRFAAPTLMAGNVGILKHAPNTPGVAETIAAQMKEAGFPEGVFQNLRLTNEQTGAIISDPRLAGVTLTGSTRAGKVVSSLGGAALKPMVMELGGSAPFIVFPDADLAKAAEHGAASRCLNNGQSCVAAKRFLVHKDAEGPFVSALIDEMKGMQVGDPMAAGTRVGPLARADLRDLLQQQVATLQEAGARVLYQSECPDGDGFFYPVMVMDGIAPTHEAAQEELFGPVAMIYTFDDEDHMLEIANGTPYGLSASLWTSDKARALRLIPQLEAGGVFVNHFVKSDPRIPFGGIKESGFGRELGREGILAFVNAKTVWVA